MSGPTPDWSPWQVRHVLLWLFIAALVGWWRVPAFRQAFAVEFYPPGHQLFLPDFFQEWASARNALNGLDVYTPHEITIQRYLGLHRPAHDPYFIQLNAHPPTAVLLGLPFAELDFVDAFFVWNVLSLLFLGVSAALIVHQLRLPYSIWMLFPAMTLLLLCHPFWHQMVHGQLNLLLLLLLTGVWVADRNGHACWAGALLALATAIKFFPGFLFVYFILRRDWSAVRAGALALLALTAWTALVLGPQTYRSYFLDVLPLTSRCRSDWHNLSLSGVWCKLFDVHKQLPPVEIEQLAAAPLLALVGMAGTLFAVGAVLARVVPTLAARKNSDLAFALTMIGMLLVSPITWDHYLLMLVLPLAILWRNLPRGGIGREVLVLLCAVLCFPPDMVMEHVMILVEADHTSRSGAWLATPLETLTALSLPCFCLIGLFVLVLLAKGAAADKETSPVPA